jgi:hypothetical protein
MKNFFFLFNFFYFFVITILFFLGLEIILRFILGPTVKSNIEQLNASNDNFLYKKYSKEELSDQLPYRHEFHGGKCTVFYEGYKKVNVKLKWHPRYGFEGKAFDTDCIKKLFSKETKNIIFFGGSGMANGETPNYLTSIEYYLFKDNLEKFRSVNFSMSGARLSNNLSIFLEFVPKIKNIDTAIFYDGINEFHSIKFLGNPSDDFYWTSGVKKRIHDPISFFFDVLTSRSKLLEVFFLNILKFDNTRIARNITVVDKNIEEAANDYIYRKKILEDLCKIYKIKCVFILQPNFYLTKNNNSSDHYKKIKSFYSKFYPNNEYILKKGYSILIKEKNIFDFTGIFDDIENTYFDDAHVEKKGSEAIGLNFKEILIK